MESEHGRDGSKTTSAEGRPAKRLKLSAQLAREVGLMRSIPGDKDSGFVGSASGIYFIRSVYDALRRSQPFVQSQGETPGSEIVPGEDDHLNSIVPDTHAGLWRPHEVEHIKRREVSFQELIEWSASYFSNWHLFHPFLQAPTILHYFDDLAQHGLPLEETDLDLNVVILRSIMSISLADRRQAGTAGRPIPSNLVFPSYDVAVDSLQHVLSKPTTELGLQATLSVQLFLVSMLRLNAASRLGGLINRMAVQLGLHRCPARYSTFGKHEKSLRRRIFWSMYSLDRFICQSMGLPLGINDDDIDVCFPLDEQHVTGQHVGVDSTSESDQQLRSLAFVSRQMRLRGEIIELRNKSLQYIQRNPDQATSITARLTQWWNDVVHTRDDTIPDGYQMTILTLLKHESIISLHRPVLAAAQQGADYDAALQMCIESARSIITTLHDAIDEKRRSSEGIGGMTLLWPSCTWAIWISTFVLFYAANRKHLERNVVARLADRSIEVLQHLAKRGSAWPEASAAAIRDLRARMDSRNQVGTNSERPSKRGRGSSQSHGSKAHKRRPTIDYGLPVDTVRSQNACELIVDDPGDTALRESNILDVSEHSALPSQQFEDAEALNIVDAPSLSLNPSPQLSDFMSDPWPSQQAYNLPAETSFDPFAGFDIPFWFDHDQHWDIFQDFN